MGLASYAHVNWLGGLNRLGSSQRTLVTNGVEVDDSRDCLREGNAKNVLVHFVHI